ncbi:hypothetical protein PFICI_05492 [Pestalotiopsis fici W106-1]|uniref:Enoyl reductase (ER) domain-containing protein n=1 Tax=Pestalotiopsis fici (strain W106-1 / CGMCC3.15140) TaxID=1229662 RepID=W3XEJ6_PESFW|nr:uncharacterized protein PFICI_05492 [Pestalotiopsis fici W106-1]ETS83616.1 hypothetical protein PFICI_05492 [Pestalotiopsis fici W106-1]
MQYQAIIHSFGAAEDVVDLQLAELPALARDKVRLRILARPINPSDIVTISGAYSGRTTLPFVPGFEAVGVVEECGDDVLSLPQGTRVVPLRSAGAWQQFVDADPDWCLHVPDNLSDFSAATSYINPMTAWLMLHDKIGVKPGMRIAVTAAASSIGLMLIAIANAAGVRPVAIVRSESSRNILRGQLEAVILAVDDVELASRLAQVGHLDAILDCVGGEQALVLGSALRVGGHFVHYGLLSERTIPGSFWITNPQVNFSHFHLREWVYSQDIKAVQSKYSLVASNITSGVISTSIRQVFPLRDIRKVLEAAVPFKAGGKVLVI